MKEQSLWVARNNAGIIGFLVSRVFGVSIHIDELSVSYDFQGKGLGRKLMDALNENARSQGMQTLTLTTDKLIPWNLPFYQRLGFIEVDIEECPIFLREILISDKEANPVPENRVAMVKRL